MQKQTVTRFRLSWSWDYEKEEQWVDNLSSQGLHLKKAYPFWVTFTKDPSTRYVYRLDHRPGLRGKEEFQNYISLYADAGWEYTGSYMATWHYFRRPWEPGTVPGLYTDRTSLIQHYQGIQRMMALALLANVPITLLNVNNLRLGHHTGTITAVVSLLVLTMLLLAYGCTRMARKIKALTQGQ